MRTVVAVVLAVSITPTLIAQGLVNFFNDANTPVYTVTGRPSGPSSIMSGPRDSFYFGLFLGPLKGDGPFEDPFTGNWTFTGIYGTNTGVNGFFSGGTVAVPGWLAGTTTNFLVAGWSSNFGHDYDPAVFAAIFTTTGKGYFGGMNGFGIAGNGSTIPTLNLFNGDPGTISANVFLLQTPLIPEPSTASIIAVGAGVSLLYRRRQKETRSPTKL